LYSTTEALNDPANRKDIVEFVRGLNKTLDIFANQPNEKKIYDFVAKEVSSDTDVVEAVLADHKWGGVGGGRWDDGFTDFLVEEDVYLAGEDKRAVTPRKELERFLDGSVIAEL
jgi:hypothetical protein